MASLQITAAGQWWSTTRGLCVPFRDSSNFRRGFLGVHVSGGLANGTRLLLQRRQLPEYSGTGMLGNIWPVLLIDAALIASRGGTGMSDDFWFADATYGYDIGCPDTFGAGDTVYVELG